MLVTAYAALMAAAVLAEAPGSDSPEDAGVDTVSHQNVDDLASRLAPIVEPGVSLALANQRAALLSELNYRLSFSIPRAQLEPIPGTMAIEFSLGNTPDTPLQIDFREDSSLIGEVRVNGQETSIEFAKEHVLIQPQLLQVGPNTVEFRFSAGPSSLNRNPDFLYTLFVPDRARTAFPVFDQPDLKATWELSLEIPGDWTALSAAPVDSVVEDGDRKSVRFARSDLISTYLFSFVAGDFQSITQDLGGRDLTIVHRETDAEKVARNKDEIFALHAAALQWLEDYTGIDLPYQKLDIALIPSHPYGGMEHVGAIQYRAESLWLDEGASDTQRMRRATLIAHEVAHMWFGNLVTMRWFDDVWTKEVFANFMAAKIVNPYFPHIDHDLGFLLDHHPGAYSVDRTSGANAIRQPLANLNQAGQLYGAIIYDKAPIMMRQLELLLGEETFQQGIRKYLRAFADGNATWPELIAILDELSDDDLATWSHVWVNTPGRPAFTVSSDGGRQWLRQADPAGLDRFWPQQFRLSGRGQSNDSTTLLNVDKPMMPLVDLPPGDSADLLFNARGYGYGLFPANLSMLDGWQTLDELPLASLLINLFEQMLDTGKPSPAAYLDRLMTIAPAVEDQLLLNLVLGQLSSIYWTLIENDLRAVLAPVLEESLWQAMSNSDSASVKKLYFMTLVQVTQSKEGLERIADVWSGELRVDQLPLSERDLIRICGLLAINDPANSHRYVDEQLTRTKNPDQQRRLRFLRPSLSADRVVRDEFFASLAQASNRATESWVLDALGNLHHPLRIRESVDYLLPSLELLEEIQATGDIFFPSGWLRETLSNHHSDRAVATVNTFLAERPDYNPQLRLKILQAADPLFRANQLRAE